MLRKFKILEEDKLHLKGSLEGKTYGGQFNLAHFENKRCYECKFWGEGREAYNPPHPTNGTMLKEQPCQLAGPFLERAINVPPEAYACKKFIRRTGELPLRKSEGLEIAELRRLAREIVEHGKAPAYHGVTRVTFKAFAYNEVELRNSTIMLIANAVRDILGRDDISKFDMKGLEARPKKTRPDAQIDLEDYLEGCEA